MTIVEQNSKEFLLFEDHLEYDSKTFQFGDILGYRRIFAPKWLLTPNWLGFVYNPPCIEVIFKNNKLLLISDHTTKNLDVIERQLKSIGFKKIRWTKIDYLFFALLGIDAIILFSLADMFFGVFFFIACCLIFLHVAISLNLRV